MSTPNWSRISWASIQATPIATSLSVTPWLGTAVAPDVAGPVSPEVELEPSVQAAARVSAAITMSPDRTTTCLVLCRPIVPLLA